MKKNILMFNIQLLVVLFFSVLNLFSQNSDSLFVKLKEQQNQKLFYQTVFRNPSLMTDFGKHKFSVVSLHYENSQNDAYRIQQPEGEKNFKVEAHSFLPLANRQTVWGKAAYNNQTLKNVRWNESIDYELIYPYFTADEIGGESKPRKVFFFGRFCQRISAVEFRNFFGLQSSISKPKQRPTPEKHKF